MKHLRHWLAAGPPPPEDAVLVVAPSAAEAERAGALIDALGGGAIRVSTVVPAADAREAARLSARFPGAIVRVPPPLAPVQGVLAALRVRAALGIDPERLRGTAARLFRGTLARGIPVYGLAGREGGPMPEGPTRPLHLTLLSTVGACPAGQLSPGAAAALLAGAVGAERDPRLSFDRLAGRLARHGPAGVTGGFIRRIDGIDALRDRLGTPRTLLCLGNGPSSVAPGVAGLAHDALFRVNLDWRGGGVLIEPDMVFVGVKRAMRRLGPVPLGVATPRKEAALIACRLFEPWHGPAVYAVAETIAADVIPTVAGARKPTTGAYMLAVAVALAPERLAIAGIDMFAHPAGAYPPGTDPVQGGSVNAFAPSHDFETDATFIAACLGRYAGELIVFGPALAGLLRARCPAARFALTERGAASSV